MRTTILQSIISALALPSLLYGQTSISPIFDQANVTVQVQSADPSVNSGAQVQYRNVKRETQVFDPSINGFRTVIVETQVPYTVNPQNGGTDGTYQVVVPVQGAFAVTFINGNDAQRTVSVGNQSRKLIAGEIYKVFATEGQRYQVAGEPRQVGNGRWVGGDVREGVFTSSQTTIRLGGGAGSSGGPVPNIGKNRFVVTVINQNKQAFTVSTSNKWRKLMPGQTWQVNVSEGQQYTATGESRFVGPDQAVGGGTFQGTFTAGQTVVHLGGAQDSKHGNGQINFSYQVTFDNRDTIAHTVSTGNQKRKVFPGQPWQVTVSEGQAYTTQADPRVLGPTRVLEGVLRHGKFTFQRKVIQLGGEANMQPNRNPQSFPVTFVNRDAATYTVSTENQQRKLTAGESWNVTATNGQEYSVAGEPRVVGPGQMVGGGVFAGTISSDQTIIELRNGTANARASHR